MATGFGPVSLFFGFLEGGLMLEKVQFMNWEGLDLMLEKYLVAIGRSKLILG